MNNKKRSVTILVEIKPEVQAELTRRAAAHGVDLGSYAGSLLEEAAQCSRDLKRPQPEAA